MKTGSVSSEFLQKFSSFLNQYFKEERFLELVFITILLSFTCSLLLPLEALSVEIGTGVYGTPTETIRNTKTDLTVWVSLVEQDDIDFGDIIKWYIVKPDGQEIKGEEDNLQCCAAGGPYDTASYDFPDKGTYTMKVEISDEASPPAYSPKEFSWEIESLPADQAGGLRVYAKDENGNLVPGATVILYDNNWHFIGKKTTNSNGLAAWDNLSAASYKLELYNSDVFWGGAEVSVTSGQTTEKILKRKAPYVKSISISGGGKVGETVNVSPQVYNGTAVKREVKVDIFIDRDRSTPWDDKVTRGPLKINAKSSHWFGRDYIPNKAGTYHVKIRVKTYYQDWTLTDDTGWAKSFTVESAPDVDSVSPNPGAKDVPVDKDILVLFTEAVEKTSAEDAFGCDPSLPVPDFSWDNPRLMRINPSQNLKYDKTYQCTIDKTVKDKDTKDPPDHMEEPYEWSFETTGELSLTLFEPKVSGKTVLIDGDVKEADRLEWNWGDGSTEEGSFPNSHTYSNKGSYTVTVTAYCGSSSVRKTKEVSVPKGQYVTDPSGDQQGPSSIDIKASSVHRTNGELIFSMETAAKIPSSPNKYTFYLWSLDPDESGTFNWKYNVRVFYDPQLFNQWKATVDIRSGKTGSGDVKLWHVSDTHIIAVVDVPELGSQGERFEWIGNTHKDPNAGDKIPNQGSYTYPSPRTTISATDVSPGGNKTHIEIDELPDGLSGYEIKVKLTGCDAQIKDVTLDAFDGGSEISQLPADSVIFSAADFGQGVQPGAENITLATLTIECRKTGCSGDIGITVNKMDDDNGEPIDPVTTSGTFSCGKTCPDCIVDGSQDSPRDLNKDSLCEDINGNQRLDFDDAVKCFQGYINDDSCLMNNGECFDFNGNGHVDSDDCVKLAHQITTSQGQGDSMKLGIMSASKQVVKTTGVKLAKGGTGVTKVILNSAPQGLSGYQIEVSLTKGAVGELTDVEFVAFDGAKEVSTLPADSVTFSAADFNSKVEAGDSNIVLARVRIGADQCGRSSINVNVNIMDDDSGYPIETKIESGQLSTCSDLFEESGIFPSPVDSNTATLHIEESFDEVTLIIFTLSYPTEKIFEESYTQNDAILDLSNLDNGVYLYVLIIQKAGLNSKSGVKKLLIQK